MDLRRAMAVAVGAVAGAGLRWTALWLAGPSAATAAVLAVNVVGAAVLGAIAGLPSARRREPRDALVGAGFCGALTTWSTLAVQVATDLRAGDWAVGLGWLCANLVLGTIAAVAGHRLTASPTAVAR